jgi:hypothetical protein
MENQQILDTPSETGILLDVDTQNNLYGAARWAKFLGTISYIFIVLQILLVVWALIVAGLNSSTFIPTFINLASLGLQYYQIRQLIAFASDLNYALDNQSEIAVTDAFTQLQTYYMISIIVIFVSILIFFVSFGGALGRSF